MITRRAILQLGAAGAGSLAIGCAFGPAGSAIRRHYKRTGEFQPNAWIRILSDNTIIFTLDRTEMGQGTTTSHAALVAEELEVDPKVLVIEPAEAARVYDNRDKQIRIQITGGSTSTASSWRPLREAGATAREMLRAAAAARWSVPIAECAARVGTIVHDKTAKRATYGELAGEAARQDVPHVQLKPPSAFRVIGTSLDRLDIRPKVDGSGVYGMDVALPGMAVAVLVRPPVRGAKLSAYPHEAVKIGEAVAFVAADYWRARKNADAAVIVWAPSSGDHLDSHDLFASYRKLLDEPGATARSHGAIPKQLPIDVVYELPYLAHATMEPQNATAWLHDGRCEVWAPTQTPGIARFRVAEATGLPLDDVLIHTTLIGGGFGRRGLVDYCVEAALLAQKIRRPVKVVWSREDDMENDWYRPMAVSRMRGAASGGAITAWHHRLVCQSILASEGGDFIGALVPNGAPRSLRALAATATPRLFARGTIVDSTSVEGAADLPYAIDHLRVEYTPVETTVPVGFWRSVGHSHNAFVTESFFDELAHAAGADPFELRRKLLRGPKQKRHLGVLELAAKKAGWGTPLPPGVGRGIAVHFSFGSYCAQVIEASVEGKRVNVRRVVVAIDCGRVVNPGLVAAQAESAVVFGLSAALKQQVTFKKGRVQETNFGSYRALRMFECPVIETHLVESTEEPTGIGEPGVPPVAPALCNAIFAATGKRIRKLPIEENL